MKTPPGSLPAGSFFTLAWLSASAQHLAPCIAFSVQVAAEFTSVAAPRTVLQAAIVSAAATSAAETTFWTIVAPPFEVPNNNESLKRLSVH